MKYAVVNGKRVESQKGITNAVCPICGELVISKCGSIKMHHWAHKNKQNCDPWWENETEWHRKWKSCFPDEFQEIIMYNDKTGDKHIADVKTKTGLVIEFQHSSINQLEQCSREQFYKNMIWIIDAREYYDKFKEHIKLLEKNKNHKEYFHMTTDFCGSSKICFPKRWLKSSVPVIFDFGLHSHSDDEYDKQKKWLYCIFPEKIRNCDVTYCGIYMSEKDFIKKVSDSDSFFPNLELSELERIRLERIKAHQEEERKMKEKRRKEIEAAFREKYPRQGKWRNAIFELEKSIKQNTLKPIKLYVSDKGEITDYNHSKCYNGSHCMVLGIKSSCATYKGIEYTKNNALILIECGNAVITATANIPTEIVRDSLEGYNYHYHISTIKAVPYYDKLKINFEYNETIYRTRKLKESLEYIRKQCSDDYTDAYITCPE